MASLGEAIFAILNGDADVSTLVDNRIRPEMAGQKLARPYIVYTRISDVGVESQADGGSNLSNARMQLDCYEDGYIKGQDLGNKVRKAMQGRIGTFGGLEICGTSIIDKRDLSAPPFDGSEDPHRRVSIDVSIWYRED